MMLRWVRGGAILFFLLFVIAVTWPGMVPFNRIEPLILGLPFSMAWIAGWVLLSFFVLVLVDQVEEGARNTPEGGAGPGADEAEASNGEEA
jgi:hypothetical protein